MLSLFVMRRLESFLHQLVEQAGSRMLRHYGRVKTIHTKAGSVTNLVTNADHDIESFVKECIHKQYPEDAILAEESPAENEGAPRKWIIDPLDGTTNFAHSFPFSCVSIGVEVDGEVVLGGVYNPMQHEFFFSRKGKGARLNGRKIRVSEIRRLDQSMVATGFPYDVHQHPERCLPYFNAMIQKAQAIRRNGSAALDLCHLAMGRYDGFFEVRLNPWDTAAGTLILREAGGMISDFEGNPHSIYKKQVAASNGLIHHELLTVLQRVKTGVSHPVSHRNLGTL